MVPVDDPPGPSAGGTGSVGVGGVLGGRVGLLGAGLELLLGLTQGAGELRELRATEHQEDDQQDDQEFRGAEVHGQYPTAPVLECVINVSEGRDADLLAHLAAVVAPDLLDVHTDPDHHRSVFTLVGEQAPRRLTEAAVAAIDLRHHAGVHPRFGAVDVVPFVPLGDATLADAVRARDAFARWAAATLDLPCFLYGPERTLPEVRRRAFRTLAPDLGPPTAHRSAGACAVGARGLLVAYNLWLAEPDLVAAKAVAAAVRSGPIRTLGLAVGDEVMVSCNLVEPLAVGPAAAWDAVAAHAPVARAELVGLVPEAVLAATPRERWVELDLAPDRTIEARLAAAGR